MILRMVVERKIAYGVWEYFCNNFKNYNDDYLNKRKIDAVEYYRSWNPDFIEFQDREIEYINEDIGYSFREFRKMCRKCLGIEDDY